MSSGANRSVDRSRSKSPTLGNNSRLYLTIKTAVSFRAFFFFLVVTLINFFQVVVAARAEGRNSGGLVDIGGGRKMYLECRGTGSPTLVLISGTRGAHDDWTDRIDRKDPNSAPKPDESAVFPQVSKFTRVCAYDRPGTTLNDATQTRSTPVQQPTTAQQGVADLHAMLIASREPRPYVLVGHSWGGLIARLFASTYPHEVAGLVLVDSASEFLKSSLMPAQWATYIEATKKLIGSNGLEAPDHERTLGLLHSSPRVRPIPVVVLTSDKRFDFGAGGAETWPAWRTAQDRLAKLLNAKHISDTNSGHAIQMEQPQLVIEAIRDVVDAVRDPTSWRRSETMTAQSGKNPPARAGASGTEVRKDFAGLVDIGGGRKMYLTCHGTGSPTVVLVSGLKASADDWNIAEKSASAVFPEVSKFSRVCSYDRPGTPVGEKPSRSDPVPQPTTAKDAVADLHALLSAAGETGPYVLVGHSCGGLVVKLYARSYPKDVSGLVLVDALSEGLQDAETSEQWPIQRKLMEGNVKASLALYPALERIDPDRSFDQVRAAPPLRSIPLVVLSADHPWGPQVPSMIEAGILPKDVPADFGYVTDAAQKKAQEQLAKLVPNAKHIVKTNSGHEIHKEQPQLVIDAIREVVGAVRREKGQPAHNETDTELPPIDES
jgi:pimeloyl-ACP methyl ester carboxylesterase